MLSIRAITHLDINVTKITGKWEEHEANLNVDEEWPTTASVDIETMSSEWNESFESVGFHWVLS